ncbi:MAG: hypothetical protein ACYC7A_20780 [Thermoanaerobaculia bacterium]
MDLRNDAGDEFRVSGTGWAFYLNLAEIYGWSPKGTERPPDYPVFKVWPGVYDRNEGQRVTDDDAANLATAFEAASGDPELATKSQNLAVELTASLRRATGYESISVDVPDDHVEYLDRLAEFVRKGSFVIE